MTGEPPITLRAIHDSGTPNLPPTRVVIHATCPNVLGAPPLAASAPGAQHGTALYFQQAAAGGSAHYVCGADGEEHCVPENVIAWHAPPNGNSFGIEINAEGGDYPRNYTRDQWLSPQVWPAVQRAAARTRDLCQRYGIPPVRLSVADLLAGKHGICGHVDVSQAWKQSTHSDPGPNFPWDTFMAAVNGQDAEDDMPYISWPAADKNQLCQDVTAAVWKYLTSGQKTQAQDRLTGMDGVQLPAIGTAAIQARDAATGANQRAGDVLAVLNTQVVPKLGGPVTVDPAALAAALLADEASVAKLGDAIAAGLAKRVGNG